VIRVAIVILLLLSAVAHGQTKDKGEDDGKVSNDQPGRPLQMPPASTEVKEALDDFDRFQRRGAWDRALKALYTIPDAQTLRFVDGENGFIIPVGRKRRSVLTALPPEGRAAYRLFYDSEAQKLFEEATGTSELTNLERIYTAYFITTVGDNAADRLGDLYFELGRFDRAAECWLAILRERPDTDLSPALVSLKAALALHRAGRQSEFEQMRSELAERYSDEKVTLAGQTASPAELVNRLSSDDKPAADAGKQAPRSAEAPLDLAGPTDPVWQVRFADTVEAGMTPPELTQWESNPLSAAVPAVAIDGKTLYANYLGHVFAVDMKTGKMLWRSGAFHHVELPAMQDQVRMLDLTRFAIVASGEHVWSLGRDLKEQNFFAPFALICRRADSGQVVWQSTDLSDYTQIDPACLPLLAGGKLFVTCKSAANQNPQQGQQQQVVLAIQPHDGKVLWKSEVGLIRQANMYFYYYMRDPSPQPRLVYRAGAVYVDTHLGVLARIDADSGALDWGFGYKTDAVQGDDRFFFFGYNQQQQTTTASSEPLQTGEAFVIKGTKSDRLYAVEPNQMKVLWERPISKSSRLLGAGDHVLFLGGPEVCALDLRTQELVWSTRLPNGSQEARVLVRPDGLWQLTPRGVFEIDPKSGEVRRIFRGSDLGAVGGDLLLTDDLLLAVSNRTISAYPRRAHRAGAEAAVRDNKDNRKEGFE
jgi:outer membrane protein assembly factor BamB